MSIKMNIQYIVKTAFFLFFAIVIFSCNGSKSLANKGDKLRESGIHKQAIEYYIQSLNKDRSNVDAQVGLRKSGGEVMSKSASKFFQAYNADDYQSAVHTYLEMEKFENRLDKYHAEVTIPRHISSDFEIAKKKYLAIEFEKANSLLAQENFEEAEAVFHEIQLIEPSYKGSDLAKLKEIAQLEPIYRRGNEFLDRGKNRAAFYEFKKVVNKNVNYKDAKDKQDESLSLAQFPIAVLKFKNYSVNTVAAAKVQANTIDELLKNKGPFIKILDRTQMNRVLNEQYLAMNGWVEGSGAVRTGELLGAKAILSGKLLSVKTITGKPSLTRKKGYKKVQEKYYNLQTKRTETKVRYEKIYYNNFYGQSSVTVSFQYILVSSETGEVLLSGIAEESMTSTVDYNTFKGDVTKLYPGTWISRSSKSPSDRVYTNRSRVNTFQNKFSANRTLTNTSELADEAYKKVGNAVSKKIYTFNPEQ